MQAAAPEPDPEFPVRYSFHGVVHPERATFTCPPVDETFHLDGKPHRRLRFQIEANQVSATLDSNDDETDIRTLRNIVLSSVQATVNAVGFVFGFYHYVEILKAVRVDGSVEVFGVDIPVLSREVRTRPQELDVDLVRRRSYGEHGAFFRRCLNDLHMAMRIADDSPFYCFRAIESLKQYYIDRDDLNEKQAWEKLAEVVGKSEAAIDSLKNRASELRHGRPAAVTDDDRKQDFTFTWEVVEAFVIAESSTTG